MMAMMRRNLTLAGIFWVACVLTTTLVDVHGGSSQTRRLSLADRTDSTNPKSTSKKSIDDDTSKTSLASSSASSTGGHATKSLSSQSLSTAVTGSTSTTTTSTSMTSKRSSSTTTSTMGGNGTTTMFSNSGTTTTVSSSTNKPLMPANSTGTATTTTAKMNSTGLALNSTMKTSGTNSSSITTASPSSFQPHVAKNATLLDMIPREPDQPEAWTWTVLTLFAATAVSLLAMTALRTHYFPNNKRWQYESVDSGNGPFQSATSWDV